MKILTWNVQWFCGLDGVVDVARVLREARAMADFDVLCLQEVAVNYPGLAGHAGFDQVRRVRALLPGFDVHFGAAVDERGRDGERRRFGNLVASRLPVAQAWHQMLPYPADAGVASMPRVCAGVTVLAPSGPLRVMTTHLEYYSPRQRLAQARALRELHAQACGHAAAPPADDTSGEPFRNKPHTASAVLCGDFNFDAGDAGYTLVQQAPDDAATTRLVDAWRVGHGAAAPHAPTFRVFDRRYGPEPIACDFFFVSEDLVPRVRSVDVNGATRASDHQPVLLTLAD